MNNHLDCGKIVTEKLKKEEIISKLYSIFFISSKEVQAINAPPLTSINEFYNRRSILEKKYGNENLNKLNLYFQIILIVKNLCKFEEIYNAYNKNTLDKFAQGFTWRTSSRNIIENDLSLLIIIKCLKNFKNNNITKIYESAKQKYVLHVDCCK